MTATEQLELELAPLVTPEHDPKATIGERFAAFNSANPHVARSLEVLAAQWLANHPRVGLKALFERLRWESGIRTDSQEYRLNNDFTSLYARLLIERRPEWADAIEIRERRAA